MPSNRSRIAWLCAAGLLLTVTGCSMRVTGVVRDAGSGQVIGGAVLTADDGRERLTVTDPAGRFALKTDWRPTMLTASAPGYEPTTISVQGNDRYPIVTIDLQPAGSQPRTPSAGSEGPTEQKLRELQTLYDRGLISNDEYKRTRTRIIGGL